MGVISWESFSSKGFSHTAVGRIAVNFGEGKVMGLPMIQESSHLQGEELSTRLTTCGNDSD
jgi:hypothetical protein